MGGRTLLDLARLQTGPVSLPFFLQEPTLLIALSPNPYFLHPAPSFSTRSCLLRVIIKLGPPSAFLKGFDIDTAWFTGNHGPAASVEGIHSPEVEPTNASDVRLNSFWYPVPVLRD